MFPERMTKEERETRLKEIGDKIAAQREFVHSGAATPEETERLLSNPALIEEKQRLEKLNGIAPENTAADKPKRKATQPTDERESQAASPAPTVATPAKATPQNKNSRFRYNGVKGADGKLKLANYKKLDDGSITVTIRNYEDSLPDIQGSVKSKSTDTSRYGGLASEYDVITINPGEPAYMEANAAYETSEARRHVNDLPQNKNSRFKYNGIKGDDGKLKLANYHKNDDGSITIIGRTWKDELPNVPGTEKKLYKSGMITLDSITVTPDNPLYSDANAAYETGQARAAAKRAEHQKKVDDQLEKIRHDANERYKARVAEEKRIEEMSAPANTKYFDIDEEQARRGHESYSLFDYKEGRATELYRRQVDYAFKLAAVAKEKTDDPELQARADMLAQRKWWLIRPPPA